jgi:IclR family acetate operon transcriptional repressor
MARGPQQDYLVQPIMKALKMLEAIGERGHDVTLTEIAESLRMPKTTAFRYLRTLAAAGFVRHDAIHDRYGVGSRVRMFAQADKSLHRLRQIAVPVMERLGRTFNETVNLAIASGFHVVYVEMIEANRPLRMQARIGERHPINATALGKAMLAFLPEAERAAIIDGPLAEMTTRTIRSAAALRRQLRDVQRNGYAVEAGETEEGLGCVGVPILDEQSYPLAAISLSAPERRLQGVRDAAIAQLREGAAEIARRLTE